MDLILSATKSIPKNLVSAMCELFAEITENECIIDVDPLSDSL